MITDCYSSEDRQSTKCLLRMSNVGWHQERCSFMLYCVQAWCLACTGCSLRVWAQKEERKRGRKRQREEEKDGGRKSINQNPTIHALHDRIWVSAPVPEWGGAAERGEFLVWDDSHTHLVNSDCMSRPQTKQPGSWPHTSDFSSGVFGLLCTKGYFTSASLLTSLNPHNKLTGQTSFTPI